MVAAACGQSLANHLIHLYTIRRNRRMAERGPKTRFILAIRERYNSNWQIKVDDSCDEGMARMPVNRDKTHLWKADTAASVDSFNQWFMESAPKAFRETRVRATREVESTLKETRDFSSITPELLRTKPAILPTLRMACCPPLAIDRLIGLSGAGKGVVRRLEKGKLPPRLAEAELIGDLNRIIRTIDRLLDRDIFPWLADETRPSSAGRHRAATIIADRLCGSIANPIIRNAQEQRQLNRIETYLIKRGYRKQAHPAALPLTEMERGTFAFRLNLLVGEEPRRVKIPIDAVIQPNGRERRAIRS